MPLHTLPKYSNVFLETGSYLGHGILKAKASGYERIISIEIDTRFYNICKEEYPYAEIHLGDSADLLWDIIKDINEPITFWLDAHLDKKNKGNNKHLAPLMEELEAIKNHPIKTHTILIDDLNCWYEKDNHWHTGFDTYDLIDKLLEINPKYDITIVDGQHEDGSILEHDILCAL